MTSTFKGRSARIVELTQGILVRTPIPQAAHSALRSGFAGYPTNPRWNAAKFRAWKTGRCWRNALDRGELIVRSVDSMLVPTAEAGDEDAESSPPSQLTPSFTCHHNPWSIAS